MATGSDASFKRVQKQRQWQDVRRTEALERQRAQRLVSIQHARRFGGRQQTVEAGGKVTLSDNMAVVMGPLC